VVKVVDLTTKDTRNHEKNKNVGKRQDSPQRRKERKEKLWLKTKGKE
tara:strand:- start:9 stop:149 length:141 start_codon:yes stop_codon:yes gene_type:complete